MKLRHKCWKKKKPTPKKTPNKQKKGVYKAGHRTPLGVYPT